MESVVDFVGLREYQLITGSCRQGGWKGTGMNFFEDNDYELLQNILESMQEGVEIVDSTGNVVFLNTAFLKITGYSINDRLGKNIFDVHPNGTLATVLKTRVPMNYVMAFAEETGKVGLSNVSPIYKNGELVGAILVCQDVSEIIELSKKLSEQNLLVDSLYKKVGEAKYNLDDILCQSEVMKKIKDLIKHVAFSDASILIEGETGTGKELLAHAIHNISPRHKKPFIQVNCAAIPEGLLESEMFGYEQGAFTGALKKRKGMFELANKGTIFLDEIGDMSVALQTKLLRVLQTNEIRRLGGSEIIKIDVRVISATNRNLREMLKSGTFREDLYYRLNVVPISVPPLRERKEDIPLLVRYFVKKSCARFGKPLLDVTPQALSLLQKHDWPGNVRELDNVIQYAVLTCSGPVIEPKDILPKLPLEKVTFPRNEIQRLEEVEKRMIKSALEMYGFSLESKKKVAEKLGISISTLYNKIKKYGIQ